ncbi:MAG: hypothetical protein IT336_02440, partial [Thermomicrobiales bacterium]|nr:hypothetical protein [Thermomicrobiales bacterium]
MDARDFDVVARIVGSACTRRRTLKTLGAALLVALGGGRLRFEALAADLGCCKCSGTKACEMDVASYGECKQLCGTKQAIFSPNHSCQPGTSIPHVCKRTGDAAQALLTADQPGVYDLAYFSAAAADALGPHTRDDSALFFTPDAAIADGFVREQGASALFDGGVQVYHDFNRIDGTDIAVISLLSQHASIDAAEAWRAYAQPQLWPPDAELLAEETSGVDVGALARFQFPSTETEGETVT